MKPIRQHTGYHQHVRIYPVSGFVLLFLILRSFGMQLCLRELLITDLLGFVTHANHLWSYYHGSIFHVSVNTCKDKCGSNTVCTGIWYFPAELECSCLNATYTSPNANGTNCTALPTTTTTSLTTSSSSSTNSSPSLCFCCYLLCLLS